MLNNEKRQIVITQRLLRYSKNIFRSVLAMFLVMALLLTMPYFPFNYGIAEASSTQHLWNLEIGDRVVDNSWQWEYRTGINYTGYGVTKPVVWIVVAKNHYGAGSGVTLLSEELIGAYCFDNSTNRGSEFGSNHWGSSGTPNASHGLRPWLNSTGIHSKEGFYDAFSSSFKSSIVTVSLPNKEWRYGNTYTTNDKVFIPSNTELGDTEHFWTYQIGSTYDYFSGVSSSDRKARLGTTLWEYWTRSPYSDYLAPYPIENPIDTPYMVCYVEDSGKFGGVYASHGSEGVRPALNLRFDSQVSETPNAAGIYEIMGSAPPQDTGYIIINIEPASARDAGAQWKLTSGSDQGWKNSGESTSELPAGETYIVTFKDISGWVKPADKPVTVIADKCYMGKGIYLEKDDVPQFGHNDIVMTTESGIRVRDDDNNIISSWPDNSSGLLPKGLVGIIIDGPDERIIHGQKYTYWKVEWDWNAYCEKVTGWTAGDFLVATPKPENETYWLARMIMSEAFVGNIDERIAVGWTAVNRKNLNLNVFGGNTIFGVVSKWAQYSLRQEPTDEIIELASKILSGEKENPAKGAGPSTHFFSPRSMSPSSYKFVVPDDGSIPETFIGETVPYPYWARPLKSITTDTREYNTFDNRMKWQQRSGIRNWFFMIYNHLVYKETTTLNSPGELKAYDSIGRITGLVNGVIFEEIHDSEYVGNSIIIHYPIDTFLYEVTGTNEGNYGLRIQVEGFEGEQSVTLSNVTTTFGAVHNYYIDWGALAEGQNGIIIKKDSDGDGIFEETINIALPYTPSDPQPLDKASDVSLFPEILWQAGDADPNKQLTYDIYFGTESIPPLKETIGLLPAGQSLLTYNPGFLEPDTKYFWRIISRDNYGITVESALWQFTTGNHVEAKVKIDPETIQLGAQGRWITAYIKINGFELNEEDVQPIQLLYNDYSISAHSGEVQNDGQLMVKFDWNTVAEWFNIETRFEQFEELTVTGEVDGIPFVGKATVRVISPQARGRNR